jgi:hypothetical protein
MRKDRAAQQRLYSGTILRGLTQPLNVYGYKYFSLLLLLFYPFGVPADISQQAKSAAADRLNIQTQLTKKCRKFKSKHFLPPFKVFFFADINYLCVCRIVKNWKNITNYQNGAR